MMMICCTISSARFSLRDHSGLSVDRKDLYASAVPTAEVGLWYTASAAFFRRSAHAFQIVAIQAEFKSGRRGSAFANGRISAGSLGGRGWQHSFYVVQGDDLRARLRSKSGRRYCRCNAAHAREDIKRVEERTTKPQEQILGLSSVLTRRHTVLPAMVPWHPCNLFARMVKSLCSWKQKGCSFFSGECAQ